MTEEEITEMEKKGYDTSSVRCKQAEIAAQEEAAGRLYGTAQSNCCPYRFEQIDFLPLHSPEHRK